MWGRVTVMCALLCAALGAPFTSDLCPDTCSCEQLPTGHLEIRCASLGFLEKLGPKQINAITALDLRGLDLAQLHPKLKKLRALKKLSAPENQLSNIDELSQLGQLTYLNLRANDIKNLHVSDSWKRLEHLDVSHNYLAYIPGELAQLPALKTVNFYDNPIVCTCDMVRERDLLLNAGIEFTKPVTCRSPRELRGQLITNVTCLHEHLLEHMQGDEGSGDGDAVTISDDKPLEAEEFIDHVPSNTSAESVRLVNEGSGHTSYEDDVGSGDGYDDDEETSTIAPFEPPKACYFDCATDQPFVVANTSDPDPDVIDEIRKGLKDIIDPFEDETTSTTTTEASDKEGLILRTKVNDANQSPKENEIAQKADEIKEASASSLNTNLLVVIALVAIMMCLVCFSIIKKRNARKKRISSPINEQEMKPLNSKPSQTANNIPEKTPLIINGQNGNMNGKVNDEPHDVDDADVALRKPNRDDDQLLPEVHRVTIQVKELSTPKTPQLINRLRSDDGQFITSNLDHD